MGTLICDHFYSILIHFGVIQMYFSLGSVFPNHDNNCFNLIYNNNTALNCDVLSISITYSRITVMLIFSTTALLLVVYCLIIQTWSWVSLRVEWHSDGKCWVKQRSLCQLSITASVPHVPFPHSHHKINNRGQNRQTQSYWMWQPFDNVYADVKALSPSRKQGYVLRCARNHKRACR